MCWDKFIILYSLTKYHLLEIFFKVAIFSFLLEIDSQGDTLKLVVLLLSSF